MNRNTFQKTKYKIPFEIENIIKFSRKFANALIYNGILYIFGFNYRGIIKFNLLTKKFSLIDDFLKNLKITNHNEKYCIYDYIKIDDKIYLPMLNSNAVIELSLEDDKTQIHYVGDEKQRYISGTLDGNNIWLAPRDGKTGDIVKWNFRDDTVKQYENPLQKEETYLFDKIFKAGKSIIIMSLRGIDTNLEINLETEEITNFDDICDAKFSFGSKYPCINLQDSKITYIDGFDLVKYDFESKQVEKISLKPTESIMKRIAEGQTDKLKFIFEPMQNGNSNIYVEQSKLNLHHLIEYLQLT